jgi:DNA-binding transcriptional ArsR family regulator
MADQEHRDQAMAKLEVLENPLRLAIFTSLALKPAGAKELSKDLKAPLEKVRYQLNRLRKAGLAEVKEERQRRGVSERIYLVRSEPFTEAEIAQLSSSQREKAIAAILKAILGDALSALRAGSFAARDDFVVARTPMALDEEGWAEAVAIHRRAQVEILAAREASRIRVEGGGRPIADGFSCLLLFDLARPPLVDP